jgi:hypothetical protein
LAEAIVPPAQRDAHRRGLARYLATREGKILDRRIGVIAMRADGSEFPVELTVTRVDLDDGPGVAEFRAGMQTAKDASLGSFNTDRAAPDTESAR